MDWKLSGALGYRNLTYVEDLVAPKKSNQYANITDFSIGIEAVESDQSWFMSLNFDFASGDFTYDGATLPTSTNSAIIPVTEQDEQSIYELKFLSGAFLVSPYSGMNLYFFAGLSDRIWNRNLTNPVDVYNIIYFPLGLKLAPPKWKAFDIGAQITILPILSGTVSAYFSAASQIDNVTLPLGSAIGYEFEFPVCLLKSSNLSLFLRPWYQVTKIGEGDSVPETSNGSYVTKGSNIVTFHEPASQMTQYGLQIKLDYNF